MHELTIFKNEEFGEIRTVNINDEVFFVGKDVAEILGYTNPQKAIRDHIDDEDKTLNESFTVNGTKGILINESGLYSLILSSKLPTAKKFKHWVTAEVLPSIRKHGAYMTEETLEQALTSPDFLIRLATELKNEKEKSKQLHLANSQLLVDNAIMKPKAEYFDVLVNRNLLTGIRETAKELKIPQNTFVKFLLDNKYLYRDKKGKLQPFANDKGYFEIKETINEKTQWSGTQVLITPKGREAFSMMCVV